MQSSRSREQESDEPLLKMKEVARLLRVHPNSLRRWANEGLLKSYRVGVRGDRRFRHEDLLEFLESWVSHKDGPA